jgi:hypothetical protein
VGAKYFGASVLRREDGALLTGAGQYVDDIKLAGMLHAAFLRSPHAHARIRFISTDAARRIRPSSDALPTLAGQRPTHSRHRRRLAAHYAELDPLWLKLDLAAQEHLYTKTTRQAEPLRLKSGPGKILT